MAVFVSDGKSKKKICKYREDTWFSVYTTLDTGSQTYSVFIDGEKRLSKAEFAEKAKDIAAYETCSRLGNLMEKLIFVYRNPVQSVLEASKGKKIYDAREIGIEADGVTAVTEKLQHLIDRCSADGGGVIYLKSGIYLSGMLKLKRGTQFYIETDATLKGTREKSCTNIV